MNRYRAYLLSEELLHGLALLVHLVAARAERSAQSVRMAASVPGRSPRARDTSTSAKAASCPSPGLPEPLDPRLSSAALASLSPRRARRRRGPAVAGLDAGTACSHRAA